MIEADKRKVLFLKEEYADGKGKYYYPGGASYEGEWKKGKRYGRGIVTLSDGREIFGKWNLGWKNRTGNVITSGFILKGEFNSGDFEGKGICTWPDGDKYVGELKDGKQHGKGIYVFSDGTEYDGEWKNGKKQGQGILISFDGAMYEGEWKEGKPNGQGTETWPNGKKYEGEWKNGKRFNGTAYNKYGKIIGMYVKGKYKTNRPQKKRLSSPVRNSHRSPF